MKYNDTKVITGVVLFTAFVASSSYTIYLRKRDRLASGIYAALQSELAPAGRGIDSIAALRGTYLDHLKNKGTGKFLILKNSTLHQLAKQLHSAWKPWYLGGDDEAKVYGIFRGLKDRVQVSQLATTYKNRYARSLTEVLKERLDDKELKIVLGLIEKLPKYRLA